MNCFVSFVVILGGGYFLVSNIPKELNEALLFSLSKEDLVIRNKSPIPMNLSF